MYRTQGSRCRRHNKECFASQAVAEMALRQIRANNAIHPHEGRRVPSRTYWEPKCETWHLTSHPERQPLSRERIKVPYIRFGQEDSEVYLFGGVENPPPDDTHVIICWGCILDPDETTTWDASRTMTWRETSFRTKQEVLDHLAEHEAAGHMVPDSAISAISADDWI